MSSPHVSDLLAAFRGKRVVITGGLGFIGSNLARELVRAGSRVLLVDSLIPELGGSLYNIKDLRGGVQVDNSDVRDFRRLPYIVEAQDVMFNLAGQTSHLDSMRAPFVDLDINCRGQLSLVEACRQHNPGIKIVFASTRQIYGRPRYLPVDEKHPIAPVDVNGVNKAAGEWFHTVYASAHAMDVSILRLTNTYGPRMRVRDERQTFLGHWIRLLLQGVPLPLYGDGSQLRDLTYIDDAVRALLLVVARGEGGGEVYNLGSDEVVSLLDLARIMIRVNGSGSIERVPFPEDRKAIDIGDYYGDFSKIGGRLGWRPQVALEDGLERTLRYYREHGAHYWDGPG